MAGKVKWDERHYVTAYVHARCGLTDGEIAARMGVTQPTFVAWKNRYPALDDALKRGRDDSQGGSGLREYVYGRLPPHLQDVWDRLDLCDEMPNPVAHIERILKDCGETEQQRLFLYALVHTGFDPSEACKRINLTKRRLEMWVRDDGLFAELYDEIQWHKGNFFERHFIDLVSRGEPSAVLHAARTYNRARGYGDVKKVEKEVNGKVEHSHSHRIVRVADLSLPAEVLVQLARAMGRKLGEAPIDDGENEGGAQRLPGLEDGGGGGAPPPDRGGGPA